MSRRRIERPMKPHGNGVHGTDSTEDDRAGAFVLPKTLDTLSALRVADALIERSAGGSVSISAPDSMTLEPFAMLYVANVVRKLKKSGVRFLVEAADEEGYAAHMGFLAEFDERFGRTDGATAENGRYVAIRELTRSALVDLANEQGALNVAETIERESRKLAELMTQRTSDVLTEALMFCLREILRNAYEHSTSDTILVCAQYRPSAGRVDLAFTDLGCGIRKTVRRNRRVRVEDEKGAIKVALLPGISGSAPVPESFEDVWTNSGYGLFMAQRICREGGVFSMVSNEALVRYAGVNAPLERGAAAQGTVVGMTIDLEVLAGTDKKRLNEFSAEGAKIARKIRGANVTASVASTNLRMVD